MTPIPLGLHLLWELDETLAGTLDALGRYGRARRSSIAVRRMYSSEVLRQVKAEAEKLAEILADFMEERDGCDPETTLEASEASRA